MADSNLADPSVLNRYWSCYSVSLLAVLIEHHRLNLRTVDFLQRMGTEWR